MRLLYVRATSGQQQQRTDQNSKNCNFGAVTLNECVRFKSSVKSRRLIRIAR